MFFQGLFDFIKCTTKSGLKLLSLRTNTKPIHTFKVLLAINLSGTQTLNCPCFQGRLSADFACKLLWQSQ